MYNIEWNEESDFHVSIMKQDLHVMKQSQKSCIEFVVISVRELEFLHKLCRKFYRILLQSLYRTPTGILEVSWMWTLKNLPEFHGFSNKILI